MRLSTTTHAIRPGLVALGLAVLVSIPAGCGPTDQAAEGGLSTSKGFTIGLLLPESKTTRYESFDRPLIELKLKQLCPRCTVLYQNADQDPAKQQSQADSMLTQGAKVLILDAVDAKSAGGIVSGAKDQGVPVVAYDRLASGPVDYYVSYDNRKVGEVQGRALLEALKQGGDPKRGAVVMINGSPTDPNAADFKAGAHAVLDGEIRIGKEYDTPDWSPDKAQQEMEQAITALGGEDEIVGVYAANDGTAGGAIAAMKGADFDTLPPVTGQDAELAAVQRILAGQQYMTVYKAIEPQAEVAVKMAYAAATGTPYQKMAVAAFGTPYRDEMTTLDNGDTKVPSVLLDPVAVTRENVKDTIVADGFYTARQICTDRYADACRDAGIREQPCTGLPSTGVPYPELPDASQSPCRGALPAAPQKEARSSGAVQDDPTG